MIIKRTFRKWASVPFVGVLVMFALLLGCGKESIDSKEATAIKDKQFQPGATMDFSELHYAEGGPSTEDPGQRRAHKFYVDSQNGLDSAPGTKTEPWKTLVRAEQHMKNSPKPGTHYLLKRGSIWTGSLDVTRLYGTPANRIVLGAYGSLSDNPPKIHGDLKFSDSSFLMVRDLEVAGVKDDSGTVTINGAIAFRQDSHNCIIYNNTVYTAESNIIKLHKGVHHMVIARNFIYDTRINDGISLHQVKWGDDPGDLGDHHWIIDNTIIGNSGMEEPIDVASTAAEDIKIVGNKIQPTSIFGSGQAHKGFVVGHGSRKYWVVGNTIVGETKTRGMQIGSHDCCGEYEGNRHVQISGNIIAKSGAQALFVNSKDVHAFHNTITNPYNDVGVDLRTDAEGFKSNNNLILNGDQNILSSIPAVPTAVKESNYNIYYWTRGRSVTMDSLPFVNWQSHYSFDLQSREEKISGISVPGSAWDDPREWDNPNFWNHFIPSSSWAVNNGSDTPGAFDSEGDRLGMTIEPIGSLSLNDGYGWEGTPLVTALLNELDVSFMHSSPEGNSFPDRKLQSADCRGPKG